jgi:hypothetical protein
METEKLNTDSPGRFEIRSYGVNPDTPSNCAGCESLKQMVRALSALVDMQELPKGFTIENYNRLLRGKPVRMARPKKVLVKRRRK